MSVVKTRVVLFGSLGVAVECLYWLLKQPSIELIGVVCSQNPKSSWREAVYDPDMQEIAPQLGIRMLTLDDLLDIDADIGISVRFHEVLRQEHLDCFKLGVINLHAAPLPEMKGSMCVVAAIIEDRKEYGTSIHWMNTKVDAGDVLAVHRFDISENDTSYDLFLKCNHHGLLLIKEHLFSIIDGTIQGQPQQVLAEQWGISSKMYLKKDVLQYKEVTSNLSEEELWNRTRAFQFPGHEPAYVTTPRGRINLTVQV
ncbi:formyltransferase family protein [Paenibacillus terrigena]|uniref:formyltransferase family protein n=1 Tax=Paenibacillus terrigena TaxID=369333 RepID=UPI00037AC6BC|nr:formyltransferase family protein [Paenibacillus terrigena]